MNRTKLDKWIEETEALPGLTREGLEHLQLERLNMTLRRLKSRGGFYRDYPEALECLSDLRRLPFTTPQMLSASPGKFLLTSQSEVSRVISGATSGTTGPAKRVFYTDRDTEHTVGFFAAGISEMLSAGEKCLIAFPFTGPFGLGDLIARAVNRLGAIPVKAGFGQTWGELKHLVQESRPETYIGFPVTLLSLIRMYGEDFPIQRALVSGDACPKGVMEELEKALGSKLYPHYGSRECGLGGAVTCSAFEGMHLRENHIIPEIIDEEGNVLPDGEYGELVITTIGAEAMPLIRYRTGDYTRILPPCRCGGITKRIDTVSRREGCISIEELDSRLFRLPGLVDYRARYDGKLRIEARTNEDHMEAVLQQTAQRMYPQLEVLVASVRCSQEDRPMYIGKRYLKIPEVRICPVKKLYELIRLGEAGHCAAVISSTGPVDHTRLMQIPYVFRQYEDLDMEIPGRSFSREDAAAFGGFVQSVEADILYCCCDAGESRSPAAAAAVMRYFSLPDEQIWSDPRYHPNMLVFDLLCGALGMHVSDEEKDALLYRSRKAFQEAIRKARR